mmetsp:Transcript_37809/g.94774  ORF Transcript_37809/g.94774 Transcript_37809/m.94774 type:complete len:334 (-) Transcript_37809:219-1220(-)
MDLPLLITGGYDHTLRYWNAHLGQCFRTIPYNDSHINCLEVTPDKTQVLCAGNPLMKLFDLSSASNTAVSTMDGHTSNVTSVGFEKTGRWFFSSSEDSSVKIWDCRGTGYQLSLDNESTSTATMATTASAPVPVHGAALHANQAEVLLGDQEGRVQVWDLSANRIRQVLAPDKAVAIKTVALSADGRLAAAANHKGTLFVWRYLPDTLDPMQKIDAHSAYVLRIRFCPQSQYLITTSADSSACLWRYHVDGFAKETSLIGHIRWVWGGIFSSDSAYVVTCSSDTTAKLWEVKTGQTAIDYTGHTKAVTAVALVDVPDGGSGPDAPPVQQHNIS